MYKSTFHDLKIMPKIALDLYMGQKLRAKHQLNKFFTISIIIVFQFRNKELTVPVNKAMNLLKEKHLSRTHESNIQQTNMRMHLI